MDSLGLTRCHLLTTSVYLYNTSQREYISINPISLNHIGCWLSQNMSIQTSVWPTFILTTRRHRTSNRNMSRVSCNFITPNKSCYLHVDCNYRDIHWQVKSHFAQRYLSIESLIKYCSSTSVWINQDFVVLKLIHLFWNVRNRFRKTLLGL